MCVGTRSPAAQVRPVSCQVTARWGAEGVSSWMRLVGLQERLLARDGGLQLILFELVDQSRLALVVQITRGFGLEGLTALPPLLHAELLLEHGGAHGPKLAELGVPLPLRLSVLLPQIFELFARPTVQTPDLPPSIFDRPQLP